jgi:hypothetical protein
LISSSFEPKFGGFGHKGPTLSLFAHGFGLDGHRNFFNLRLDPGLHGSSGKLGWPRLL